VLNHDIFFQYNLAIQLFLYNSAFLITKKNPLKLQQAPGYFAVLFGKQPLILANGRASCKQMPGSCCSSLPKARNTAANEGT